ncbi:polysialyltransferase family glycosyltransferase [Scytonema sp. NUACC26]|uniref:polysialyltransferase family glycosyltransferase n=1 Tax=Scytonema sp. NUACC26 TaxID=3140176 RepID=UPI0034DCB2D5
MTHRQLIKRVITCQGSVQLVTALSILSYREKEQQHLGCEYENYLVIYDLYAPSEQIDGFVALIKKMAELICNWRAIVYITPTQLQDIDEEIKSLGCSKGIKTVHELIGIEAADEIYLCRNWQFGNQLLINAYQSAQKICYGDSIGIYFSSTSKGFSVTPTTQNKHLLQRLIPRLRFLKNKFKGLIAGLNHQTECQTALSQIEFDRGYFVLPDILGECPPMPIKTINKSLILETLQKLKGLADPNYIARFQEKIAGLPVVVLLTSNLSEAGRMFQEDEITAYCQFLNAQGTYQDTLLVIKPHPRDDITKIEKLKDALANLFSKILVLSEPELFFLPFEVFFLEAFLVGNNDVKVFALSSACISLKLLFDVPSIVGFGDDITSKWFYESYVTSRLIHERDLRAAVKNIEKFEFASNV